MPNQTATSSDSANDLATATRACAGDQTALLQLLKQIQPLIYNIARRMVWHPADAEDLVQEANLRIITNLAKYSGQAKFSTWAYRVAFHAMLNTKRRRMEETTTSFEAFGEELENTLSLSNQQETRDPDEAILLEEVKLGCMTGMLLCLNRPERLAYILGEIFELDTQTCAELCEVEAAAFRQRLSRARRSLNAFTQAKCGLVSEQAKCRCKTVLPAALNQGKVARERLLFADAHQPSDSLKQMISNLDEAMITVSLFRNHPSYQSEMVLEDWLQSLISSGLLSSIIDAPAH